MNRIQEKIHKIKMGNDSLERVGYFKYLGTNLTKQNFIREETEGRLKSRNARYHSVQNKKNMRYRIVILPLFCIHVQLGLSHGGREEHKLRLFENRVLREILA